MIDWTRAKALLEEIGPDDFAEVAALFLEEADSVIERLRDAPDPARFEEDLHFLKGSALNLGFEAMAEACSEGERIARAGRWGAVDISALISLYSASKQAFLARIQQGETISGS